MNKEKIQAAVATDGLIKAIATITTSIATRCNVTAEVKEDIDKAIKVLSTMKQTDPSGQISILALSKTSELLEDMIKR